MSDTQYTFQCAECGMTLRVRLGWILKQPHHPTDTMPEPALQEAATKLMSRPNISFGSQYEFERVQCGMCNTVYVIQEHITPNSMDAYRVQITDIARVL